MHGRNRTLALSLSTFLLMGCTSAPPKQPAAAGDLAASSIRPTAHEIFFANMVAAIAAMGGNNPNPAYQTVRAVAISSRGCSSDNRLQATPPSNDTQGVTTERTAASASCRRVAAVK